MPKQMYNLIFWGLILPIFDFEVMGVRMLTVIGYAMVAYGAWVLGRQSRNFRFAAIGAALLAVTALTDRWHSNNDVVALVLGYGVLLVQCAHGWFLLTGVAADCESQFHLDTAANARKARVIYVMITLTMPAVLNFVPTQPGSNLVLLLPLVISIAAYVVLVWTVQSAKVRLFS